MNSATHYEMQHHVSTLWDSIPPNCRTGRVAVREALAKAVDEDGVEVLYVVSQLIAYYQSPQGKSEYRLKPANFISQGCYDDDPAAWQNRKTTDSDGIVKPTGAIEQARRVRLEWEREWNRLREQEGAKL